METQYGDKWWRRDEKGNGPEKIDQVHAVRRDGKCLFKFTRERRRAQWVPNPERPGWMKPEFPKISMNWWCSAEHLTCVDAYTPGDFRIFFDDPRTRTDYLQWAPILLAAEDWHHERRQAADQAAEKSPRKKRRRGANRR